MHKLIINHNRKKIDFFLHDATLGKKGADSTASIIIEGVYPHLKI